MNDEMLAWQARRFTELATDDDGWVVHVRPEQVVEVAFDGCSGPPATRTASPYASRARSDRDDKAAGEADTVASIRSRPTGA